MYGGKEGIKFHIDVNSPFLSWIAICLLESGSKEDQRTVSSFMGEIRRHGIVSLSLSPSRLNSM